jgi:magnesium transporter
MTPTAELILPEVQELIRSGAFGELREALQSINAADIAEMVNGLDPADAAVLFRFLPRDDAGEVFSYLDAEHQQTLITELGASAVRVVEGMHVDDRAKLLDELPTEVAQRIIASLTPEERKSTQAILGYAPKSVGRLMTPDYVRLKPEWTIAQALDHIRRYGRDAETVNVVYVIDDEGKLVDDVRLRQLLFAPPDATVESQMNRNFVALTADQPQEEAVRQLQRYDRIAMPVVDSRGVLLGIVTHDDVADVAQAEATEDIQKIGGMQALEQPYLSTPLTGLFMKRAPWLALLFMSELLTSNAIAFFEDEIKRAAVLAAFIPAIISSGGNSGSQASTLVVRALALNEITLRDWHRVLLRELCTGLMLGGMIGVIGLFRINLWGWLGWWSDAEVMNHYSVLAVTIGVTLTGVVLWGSIMGSMLPFVLKRCGLDPATSSTPFVATLVDVTGIVIYFSCAMAILSTTLLREGNDRTVHTQAVVTVISVDNYDPGDKGVELTVQSDDQRALGEAGASSHILVPIKGVEGGQPPKAGDRVLLEFHAAEAATLKKAP